MNVHEAYAKLGLEPLDDFLVRNGPSETRGIGATTWMLVEAALVLLEGKDVVLVGHDLHYARVLVDTCVEFINVLGGRGVPRRQESGRTIWFDARSRKMGNIHWESENTVEKFQRGRALKEIFSDPRWKLRAMDRQKGPFACIRKIDKLFGVDGNPCFRAYDDRGTFLLELTEEGAHTIVVQEGMKIERVGW